jgi:low temperature requirement protein LtrA
MPATCCASRSGSRHPPRSGSAQLVCWGAALLIEYAGPFALFQVPGLGRSQLSDWNISGSHMAERCGLFIIIALGEGIVVTGASLAGLSMEPGRIAAFVIAFLGSALMWWLYFDLGMERGARHITGHAQAGRVARNAYTYVHMPIVLGIIISAVGDAALLEHWNEPASASLVLFLCGGSLLFLIGVGLFKRFSNSFGNFPFSHLVAVLLLVALGLVGLITAPQGAGFAAAGVAILFVTAVWEWVSYHGGWIERMEARGWRLGIRLREHNQARAQRRAARKS